MHHYLVKTLLFLILLVAFFLLFIMNFLQMAMAGISPQILMKSAYRSVMFFTGQRELEMQYKMNRIVAQCRQKCESMQEKFTEKLEQLHAAYQKMAKRCQMMEQEIESSRRNFLRKPEEET
ncbi:E3 ubiquitin-protein ligase CCNB1IP1 [Populus alba x Populus x berolinensis]|nr:E3 ubiquitin-protein ligase CCNB1IP1 [Populus alba x Populus x berolinensis]